MIVCDDYNFEDGVELMESLDDLKHVIVIGSEGKARGCIPVE